MSAYQNILFLISGIMLILTGAFGIYNFPLFPSGVFITLAAIPSIISGIKNG